jgi:TatD DNase family protein
MVVGRNKEKYLSVPKDRILIESDGPYTKIVGKKFDPSFLYQSYELIGKFFDNSNLCADVFDNFNSLLSK